MSQFNQLNLCVDNTDYDNDTNNTNNTNVTIDPYHEYTDYRENRNISYFEWLNTVETVVFNRIGLYLDDLPDETYRINFDDGMSVQEMAKIVTDPYDNMINDSVGRILFDKK